VGSIPITHPKFSITFANHFANQAVLIPKRLLPILL